jgi:subtilisin family serine protease
MGAVDSRIAFSDPAASNVHLQLSLSARLVPLLLIDIQLLSFYISYPRKTLHAIRGFWTEELPLLKPALWFSAIFLLCASILSSAQSNQPAKYVPGQLLVKFRANTRPASVRAAHLAVAANVVDTFNSVEGLQLVRIPASMKLSAALATYRANPQVQYAEPDYIVHSFQTPTDPLFPSMWSLLNNGQSGGTIGADIKAAQAWNLTTGSSNVIVAVIDSGVDYTHPDLAANIFSGPICPGGVVCHGITSIFGSVLDPNDPFDDNGHGTHVSGTIGAIGNNSLGVTGINWNVTILPCKFLNAEGAGATSDAIKCLDFIKSLKDTQGLNIVASNNSWGGTEFSQALEDAIDRQRQSGILFIAAAGNDFADNDLIPTYPASFPLPNIISVAATDRNDHRASFSNIGRHTVHIGAPGQDILSTLPGGTYGTESGTSMATPHVTGVAALLAAQDPTRDWRAIKNLILAGGDPDPDLSATISGRRLDAFSSLTCVNSPVSGRLAPVTDITSGSVGVPLVLNVLNINCAQPAGPVQVTVTPGGQSITLTDDGAAPDLSAADGVYSGAFTPASPGVYTLAFSTGDVLSVQVLNNYQAANALFNYRAIAGTNLNLSDDSVAQVTSPFPIAFGDGSFSQLWISANGTISFTGAFSSYLNMPLPTGTPFHSFTPLVIANTIVAPFWDDLVPKPGTAQNVFWDVTGVAPNRELVVEWRDLLAFDCFAEPDTVKFQVVFFENSSDILFNYADTAFGGSCVNHDNGNLATEGVQVAPNLGTLWGFEAQDVTSGSAVVWKTSTVGVPTPPAPVITSISPGTVNSFGPAFTLTVNGSNFVPQSKVTFFLLDRPTTFVSSTQLIASIPATDLDPWLSNTGPRAVIVSTRGFGTVLESNPVDLNVTGPTPTIDSVTPSAVPPGSFGFLLTINGSNFVPFATVNVNGQPLPDSVALSPSVVTAVVPGDLLTVPAALTITVSDPTGGTSAPLTLNVVSGAPPAPIASSQSYLIQRTPGSRALSTPQRDIGGRRFLGWNLVRSQGLETVKRFSRPYAPLFTAPAQQHLAPSSVPLAVAPPLALPGLDIPEPLASGFLPTAVATGDFNRDGHPDWIVSNGGSNDLWLYLGNGDGTAQLPRIIPLGGQSPVAIAAVDLRGIGVLDLVVAEPDSLSLGVLLGNGDGTFAPEKLYFVPAPPLSLTVADFNRDGHPDVVVGLIADNPVGAVAFFAGDGTGKFLAPVTTPLNRESSPAAVVTAITTADLNNDGIPDLLVTDENILEPGTFVFLGVGDGTFKGSQNLGGLLNAAIGDLNGDGCPDAVTIDAGGLAAAMIGHCDGTFQVLQPLGFFGEGETGIAMALADVNGDGKLDLVTSGINLGVSGVFGQDSGNLISVSFGDGLGGFEPAKVYRAQTGMFGLAVLDLNGDLHPDIVVASQDTDSVSVLMNDGTGRFGGPQGSYIGWVEKGSPANNFFQGALNAPISVSVADLDGDGKKDLLSVDFGQGFDLPVNLVISMNDGLGNFLPDKKIPVLDGRFQFFGNLVLGDFRGTGLPDIVLTPNHLSVSFTDSFFVFVPNLGLGNFGTPVQTRISALPGVIATGDFNGDGKLDFVMVGGSPSQIVTFLGNGDGTFAPAPSQPFSGLSPEGVLVGDFNGDGKLDVLVPQGGLEFLGNGDGAFAPPKAVIPVFGNPSFANPALLFQAVDLNHDGRMDLIQRNALLDDPVPIFRIYFAQPDGSFLLQNTYSPYTGQPIATAFGNAQNFNSFVGDFNGDGAVDIAAFQLDPLTRHAYVQFILGNGDGSFTPTFQRFNLGSGNPAFPNLAVDMNGDGKADFVELDGFTSAFNVIHAVPGKPFTLQYVSLPVLGTNGIVRLTLSTAAAQDTILQLSASDLGVTVPPSVTVPAGNLTTDINFNVAPGFDTSRTFTITASNGVDSASALASVAIPGGAVGFVVSAGNNLFKALLPGQSSGDIGFTVISRGGYQTTVSGRCDGLPPGVTCQFGNPTLQIAPGRFVSTPLTLAVTTALAIGDYPFNVTVSDQSISQTVPLTLHVGDVSLQLNSQSGPALSSGFESFQLTAAAVNHFSGVVNVNCSGLPGGATCQSGAVIVDSALPGPSSAAVAINTSSLAVGDYPFLITADTGFTQHSVNAVLHVGDIGAGSVNPPSANISVGQSATFNLSVASVNGFSDTLTFFCSPSINGVGVSGISCGFSPVRASFDASGKLTDQITVTATARPRGTHLGRLAGVSRLPWYAPLALTLAFAAVFAFSPRTRKKTFMLYSITLLLFFMMVACGGGGGSGPGGGNPGVTPTPTPAPTPTGPQTVNIDVFATSQAQFQTPSKKLATFSVTVQ